MGGVTEAVCLSAFNRVKLSAIGATQVTTGRG
jgi:hypothetical protein